jgi:gliding motility-associated-like protein
MDNFAQTNLFIFNRYGKLLTIKHLRFRMEWNLDGISLPADDYWFKLTLKMEKL